MPAPTVPPRDVWSPRGRDDVGIVPYNPAPTSIEPVGADAYIRPRSLQQPRGRDDVGIVPYNPAQNPIEPVGGDVLAAARSTRGSDSPPDCHSLPFVSLRYLDAPSYDATNLTATL